VKRKKFIRLRESMFEFIRGVGREAEKKKGRHFTYLVMYQKAQEMVNALDALGLDLGYISERTMDYKRVIRRKRK
jgi:hypothetical protein